MDRWSIAEIEFLKRCYKEKIQINKIAKKLGRSEHSVRNKAYSIGISHKNVTDEQKRFLIENYKSYNLQEMADYLHMSKPNTCRLAREVGIERTQKKKEFPEGKKDERGVYHKNGWIRKTPEQISKQRSWFWKEWHKTHEHPRGMLGKHQSEEYRKQISKRVKKYWSTVTAEQLETRRIHMVHTKMANGTLNPQKNCNNPYSRAKGGKRKDLNDTFFRSSWEANLARFFNFTHVKWQYEPKTFYFSDIKKGCISYTPDFYLPEKNIWVEVKGWMDPKSITKLKRFAKYFPEESNKLVLITQKEYREYEKYSRLIPNWE